MLIMAMMMKARTTTTRTTMLNILMDVDYGDDADSDNDGFNADVPIVMVTARADTHDVVAGLEAGADDYLTKPFSMRELVARCRALLRRQRLSILPQIPILKHKDITLNARECRVMVRGEEVNLSPKEFRLLELFMNYTRRVWSREQLLDQVWGPDFVGDSKTVDVHIRWLREKLEIDPSHPECIVTVRGFGYRFG
jgi:two-component system phosphate regulon response regulator PhoB